MKTTTDIEKNKLHKRYFALSRELNYDRVDRQVKMMTYGVDSSCDLSAPQLRQLCIEMEAELQTKKQEQKNSAFALDKHRKRVMAAIGGWLKLTGQESSAQLIYAIACRSTGHRSFNDIPASRLNNIYKEWLNKQKDFKNVNYVAAEELAFLASNN